MYWANPETGCSANFWLRAMGWFLVAMVDTLERMDNQLYYEYRAIMAMLKDAVDAMIAFQDAESGMFWQVVDKAGVEGNYLETSGSALFAYAVLKGVRLGYLPKRYTAYGEKAFYGTCDRHLGVDADGALQLGGICLVAGLGGATRRDGSLAYYFSEPSSRTTPRAWARCCWPTRKFWPHKSSKEGTLCRNLSSVPACTTTARAARTSCSGALPPTALPLCSWPIKSVCRPSGAMRT